MSRLIPKRHPQRDSNFLSPNHELDGYVVVHLASHQEVPTGLEEYHPRGGLLNSRLRNLGDGEKASDSQSEELC